MLYNGRPPFVKEQGNGILSEPEGFVGIEQLNAIFPVLELEDKEFCRAIAYGEILVHNRLLLGICGQQSSR